MSKKKGPGGKGRKIGRGTVSLRATLSHYSFRTRLLQKAARTPECSVLIYGEAYTSKTCGRSGKINPKLGSWTETGS
jgi:transposase